MAEVRNPFTYTPQYLYEQHVFVGNQPVRKPVMPAVPPASDDYYIFLATVFGESSRVQKAWEAVADSIVLRAAQRHITPGGAVQKRFQYSAYTDPSVLSGTVDKATMKKHGEFLKAYASLTKQKLNGRDPLLMDDMKRIVTMDAQVRPIYALYTNQDVLLPPIINAGSPTLDDTAPERYKTMNPKNPLKFYITNYYSPIGEDYHYIPEFLDHIPKDVKADDYLVPVPDVNTFLFLFYNIPQLYH